MIFCRSLTRFTTISKTKLAYNRYDWVVTHTITYFGVTLYIGILGLVAMPLSNLSMFTYIKSLVKRMLVSYLCQKVVF